jgi:hypothetical protein
MRTRQQGSTLFAGVLVMIATLVVIQLWLLTAALEALLAHHFDLLLPAAIASFVLFVANGLLLRYVISFDERVKRGTPS